MKAVRAAPHLLLALALAAAHGEVAAGPGSERAAVARSPVDLVLARDESWLATVNQGAGTISLVRPGDGKVLDELPVGEHPSAAALRPDGKGLLVTCAYSGDVRLLEVRGDRILQRAAVPVGFHPYGVDVGPDGRTAFVALTAADQVAVIDLDSLAVVSRIPVGRWPRHLCLSPDGKRLAVGTSGDRGVCVLDVGERKVLYSEQFVGLDIGHLRPSSDGRYAYFPWMVYRRNPITESNIRQGWVLASRIARVSLLEEARREAVSLDPRGKAIADPHGIALTSDDRRIVVSAGGTHELLVYRSDLPFKDRGGPDHVDPEVLADPDRFSRIELGGRPLGLRIARDDATVYVANYLLDAVQVVDLKTRTVLRTLSLGASPQPSLARRGEAIFYDGRRSLDQWYSCHTCHYEGATNSVAMDTLNDGTRFTFKTVLPLFHLEHTEPWTWHGWQKDLRAAMKKSLQDTMLGPQPSDEDVDALLAFLKDLRPPPNPFREPGGGLSDAAKRGEAVFRSERAACSSCHAGPYFTDGGIHDVGSGSSGDKYKGFNTPSLLGVYSKVLLFHDGRASTLEELLTGPHAPDQVRGTEKLSETDLRDLVAYLKSL